MRKPTTKNIVNIIAESAVVNAGRRWCRWYVVGRVGSGRAESGEGRVLSNP